MKKRILAAIVLLSLTACAAHEPSVMEIEEINQYHERLAAMSEER